IEKDIAEHLKKGLDSSFEPTWHVIVGRNFGAYVTHEGKHFIYAYVGKTAVMAYKN
ncbi:MAG: Dynein light chain 1, cytoplasmic, partial [Paramarteilia canceri]